MKKNLRSIILLFGVIFLAKADAQWCVPPSVIPYNANMPGITHVIINTIDRVSTDLENYPNNSYVSTGLSTQLIKGQTYDVSITYTIDGSICPDMNLRVWIDYNQDYQLDDVGETVISVNNQLPGTYIGSFTIPANANLGNTRMRVTAKMTPNGGHTMPTPCDDPPDPFGYHGEMEDYDVEILSGTGIDPALINASAFSVTPSSVKINFSFSIDENSSIDIKLIDMQGRMIKEILPSQKMTAGKYNYDVEEKLNSGIYLAVFTIDERSVIKKIVVN